MTDLSAVARGRACTSLCGCAAAGRFGAGGERLPSIAFSRREKRHACSPLSHPRRFQPRQLLLVGACEFVAEQAAEAFVRVLGQPLEVLAVAFPVAALA